MIFINKSNFLAENAIQGAISYVKKNNLVQDINLKFINVDSDEEAFLNRYPGLELKDYTSTDIEVRAALFNSEVDLDNPDRKLLPEIRSAAGIIEFPITLPADFKHPDGVMAFYGLFADINFLLSGWLYEPTYAGRYGWNEIKDQG